MLPGPCRWGPDPTRLTKRTPWRSGFRDPRAKTSCPRTVMARGSHHESRLGKRMPPASQCGCRTLASVPACLAFRGRSWWVRRPGGLGAGLGRRGRHAHASPGRSWRTGYGPDGCRKAATFGARFCVAYALEPHPESPTLAISRDGLSHPRTHVSSKGIAIGLNNEGAARAPERSGRAVDWRGSRHPRLPAFPELHLCDDGTAHQGGIAPGAH